MFARFYKLIFALFLFPISLIGSEISPLEATREWNASLALQAASWGAPLVTMYLLRYNDSLGPNTKAEPNSIWKMEDITTPALSEKLGYVTPNVNVIYGFGFMDLRQEPIVVEVPDSKERYYMVQAVDMWTNSFAYMGGKSTGYKGGTFVLVGPNWKGEVPKGLKRIDCPTPWVLLQPRVHIYYRKALDLPGAKKILQAIKPMPLSQFMGKRAPPAVHYQYPKPNLLHQDLPVSDLDFQDPLQFWEILSLALNENPPPQDQIEALLPLFKPLGLELGKTWDRKTLPSELLKVMSEAAQNLGDILAHLRFGTFYQGAMIPSPSIGNAKTDYRTRAVVARVGLTANTPYEAIYWMYVQDVEGKPLMGNQKYTLTFKEGIPFYEPGFWSITLYSSENNYTIENPINRYMIGSDSPQLKKNVDGSFTLYIQNESPGADKESNWLPSPKGPFYLIPRAYAPKPQAIQILENVKAWPIPAVIPVKTN